MKVHIAVSCFFGKARLGLSLALRQDFAKVLVAHEELVSLSEDVDDVIKWIKTQDICVAIFWYLNQTGRQMSVF